MPKKATPKKLPNYIANDKSELSIFDFISQEIEAKKRVATYRLPKLQHHYQETGNPLFIWEAYQETRKALLPIPGWVAEYLDQVAERAITVEQYSPEVTEYIMGFRKTPDGPGTGGGASLIKQRKTYSRKMNTIIHAIFMKKGRPEMSLDDICNFLANEMQEGDGIDITGDTIKKWYYEYDKT